MALTKVSGSVLKNPLSLSGNVSVGGTLTYEDVTNVDSVGIITARQGIFIDDSITHIGDTNTKISFPAADTFTVTTAGSERFRIDSGGRLLVGTTSNSNAVRAVFQGYQGGGDNFQARVQFQTNQATNLASGSHLANLLFTNASGSVGAQIDVKADAAWGTNDYPARIEFKTTADGANTPTERLRIDSSGNIGAGGVTSPLWTSGGGIHLNDNYGIGFGNGGSGRPDFQLMVVDGSKLEFRCGFGADTADIVMDTSGRLGVGDNSPDRELVVKNASSNSSIKIEASNAHTSQLFFSDTDAENVARIAVFHGSGQTTSNGMLFGVGGTARLLINSSGQLIVNSITATDAIFTVSSPNHYVVTSSGKAHKHIHCRSVNGNSGEYGGAISFGMGSDGSSAIAAEQMGSSGNVNGLAFFTHPTSTGSDDAVKRMKITNTGGIQLNNYGSTRGFIFQRLGAGTYPDFPNVQGSQGRGMCDGQRVISANTATEIAKTHWGGLALVGYSNGQHQGTAQVMFGYGGAGASVRFSGHWVRQESLTITFTVSAYSLMISHNASNDLNVWCILIGV